MPPAHAFRSATPFSSVVRQVGFAFTESLTKGVQQAVAEAGVGVGEHLATFADLLGDAVGSRRRMISTHERIAEQMRSAVVRRYEEVVEGRKMVPSYRAGQNRLPGALRAAVANPINYQATRDGIAFINEPYMNKAAAHWRRLNFGTAERPSPSPQQFLIQMGESFSIGLRDDPGAPVLMPRGFWVMPGGRRRGRSTWVQRGGEGSTDMFFPTGKTAFMPTRGIEARNFFDAGVETLARVLPREYERLYAEWFAEANALSRGPAARAMRREVKIPPPRPFAFR